MTGGKISPEDLKASMEYLENFEKGHGYKEPGSGPADDFDESEATNGEASKLKQKHEQGLAKSVAQAKFHKEALDKMEKGEDVSDLKDPSEEDEEGEEKVEKALPDTSAPDPGGKNPSTSGNVGGEKEAAKKDVPNGQPTLKTGSEETGNIKQGTESDSLGGQNFEEMVKGAVSSALAEQQAIYAKEKEDLLKGFEDRLKKVEDQPIQKSIIKGAQGVALQKAFTEAKEAGKDVLFATQQPMKVSDALYKAFTNEKDDMVKSQIGDSIATFESAGYISPSVLAYMAEHGTAIM